MAFYIYIAIPESCHRLYFPAHMVLFLLSLSFHLSLTRSTLLEYMLDTVTLLEQQIRLDPVEE